MNTLGDIRKRISDIDLEMARLFEERMHAVKKIAQYKSEHQLSILDEEREQELLKANSLHIRYEEYLLYYLKFQQNVMNISKDFQKSYISTLSVSGKED